VHAAVGGDRVIDDGIARRGALDGPPALKVKWLLELPQEPTNTVSKRHALVARVFLGTSKVAFPSSAPRLLNEPLPFLSHFGQKCFETRISCRASFLKASRRKSLILSGELHFPTPNERVVRGS
jgi:hypothetical protein